MTWESNALRTTTPSGWVLVFSVIKKCKSDFFHHPRGLELRRPRGKIEGGAAQKREPSLQSPPPSGTASISDSGQLP